MKNKPSINQGKDHWRKKSKREGQRTVCELHSETLANMKKIEWIKLPHPKRWRKNTHSNAKKKNNNNELDVILDVRCFWVTGAAWNAFVLWTSQWLVHFRLKTSSTKSKNKIIKKHTAHAIYSLWLCSHLNRVKFILELIFISIFIVFPSLETMATLYLFTLIFFRVFFFLVSFFSFL